LRGDHRAFALTRTNSAGRNLEAELRGSGEWNHFSVKHNLGPAALDRVEP